MSFHGLKHAGRTSLFMPLLISCLYIFHTFTYYMPLLLSCLYLLHGSTCFMSILVSCLYLLHAFTYFMPSLETCLYLFHTLLVSCLIHLCYVGLCDHLIVHVLMTLFEFLLSYKSEISSWIWDFYNSLFVFIFSLMNYAYLFSSISYYEPCHVWLFVGCFYMNWYVMLDQVATAILL